MPPLLLRAATTPEWDWFEGNEGEDGYSGFWLRHVEFFLAHAELSGLAWRVFAD